MEGCRATHMLTRTHTCIHLPYAVTHNSSQLVVGPGPPGSAWRLLASARAKVGGRPSIPVGVTLLLLAAQVLGSGSVELGKGTPTLLGRPCSLLLICVLGQPALLSLLQNVPGEE